MDRMGSGLTGSSGTTVVNRSIPIFNTISGSGPRLEESPQQGRPPRAPVRGGPTRGNNRKERSSGPSRTSFNEDGGGIMGTNATDMQERRRNPVQYNDNHQLFMGNLPLDATEEDLRVSNDLLLLLLLVLSLFALLVFTNNCGKFFQEIFSKFGNIVDLRIHSKTNTSTKGPPGNRVPNYGFITFEHPQSVQDVLNNKVFVNFNCRSR